MANFNQNYNNNYGYGAFQPNYYQQPKLNQYDWVNGISGAKAYQVMPNQTMLLMDSDNPIVFMKTADSYGKGTLRYFKLIEVKEEDLRQQPKSDPNSNYVLKSDFEALNQKYDDLSKKIEKMLKKDNKGGIDNA